MWAKFSTKTKILISVSVVLAFGTHYWITSTQEVKKYISQLEKGTLTEQITAAHELGSMGYSADNAIPVLSDAITGPDEQLRSAAIYALYRIDRKAAVHALSSALTSRDAAVRLDAAEALERMGSPAAKAALASYSETTRKKYNRASLGSWADKFRRQMKNERKKEYRRHKKIYGNPR
jgi:HEAT repeat protein